MIIVDRIEGKVAVCETDTGKLDIPVKLIRGKVRDGVVIVERNGTYVVDEQATEKRTAETKDITKGLWDE